jgi:hypothetical protein
MRGSFMKIYIVLGLLISLAIIFLMIYYIPSTDDLSPDNPFFNGLSTFVSRYNVSRISISDLDKIGVGTIVFLIGPDKNFDQYDAARVRDYLLRGGIFFIADDYGTSQELIDLLRINISLYRGVLRDPLLMYKNSYLPRVDVYIGRETLHLYMNYGTAIDISKTYEGSCIGYSSVLSFLEIYEGSNRTGGKLEGPLCILYNVSIGEGVLYVFSDSSIFINSMIDVGDNNLFIKYMISSYKPYIITDKWSTGSYTVFRESLINMLSFVSGSLYKYVFVFGGGVMIYIVFYRISRRGVVKIDSRLRKEFLREILERHPDWDENILRKIVEEDHYERRS